MEYGRLKKWCKERTRGMRSKYFSFGVDFMARCSFPIDFCASSSSCCCIIVAKLPSLIIMFSFFSRFCTSSSSSNYSAKATWASLEIALLSSNGLEMAIVSYHSWGELIYNFFGTDLLISIFVLFSAVSFEKFSSLCCSNAERIASLLVAGQRLLRHRAVPLTP